MASTTGQLSQEELRELLPEFQRMTMKYKHAERVQKALLTISETSSSLCDLAQLYTQIHDIVDSFMVADNMYVCFYDDDKQEYDFAYFIDEHDQLIESRHPADELTSSITEYLVKSGEPLLLTQENRDARCQELNIKIVGTKPSDLVGVPLKQHQRTVGCLVVQSYNERVSFSEEDLAILGFVSQNILTAVERVKFREITEQTIQKRTRQLKTINTELEKEIQNRESIEVLQTALFNISELAADVTHDMTVFYAKLHIILRELINAPNCIIMLVEADHPPHCVFFNHPEPFMQGPDELMKTLTQYVFSTGSVELINSPQALDLAESGAISVTLAQTMLNNPQSWLSAPLLADKELMGMIAIQSYGQGQKYTQRDVELMRFVSYHIGIALQRRKNADALTQSNARLEHQVAERTEELKQAVIQLQAEIEKSKQAEIKLMHDAFYDNLTGLMNRAFFIQRLELAVANKKRFAKNLFAVIFIDLDRFKLINDTLGHQAGDHLLIEVAHRLELCVRSHDTLSRLGGDEFVILLDNYKHDIDVEIVANRILNTLNQPFEYEGKDIRTGASLGIAILNEQYNLADEVLRDADAAMYHAKDLGRSQSVIFNESMREELLESIALEQDFRQSMEQSEFECFLQPVVNLTDLSTPYYECFIRWFHPDLGAIKREKFWRIAEQTRLTSDIDTLLLDYAINYIRQREKQGNAPIVAVNISVQNITQAHMTEALLNKISASGINAQHLALEFDEYNFQNRASSVQSAVKKLKRAGISIILDNFGSGIASMSDLFAIPFDYVKIDKQYARALPRSQRHAKFIHSVKAITDQLQCRLIVDGVDDDNQLAAMHQMNIEYAQGKGVSKAHRIYDGLTT